MAIKKKLVCFKKQANFDQSLKAGEIQDYSIVFIMDTQRIWTHGVYFSSLAELNASMEGKQDALTEGDNITIEDNVISAKDTTYTLSIDGNTIKLTSSDGDEQTITLGDSLPSGGTTGQVLTKTASGAEWADPTGGSSLPEGGTAGQVLTKTESGAEWKTPEASDAIEELSDEDLNEIFGTE